MSKLSFYVQRWLPGAIEAVRDQRNAVAIKCHETNPILNDWRVSNPGAEIFLRLHNSMADLDIGTANLHRWEEFTQRLIDHANSQPVRPDVLHTPFNEVSPYADNPQRIEQMERYAEYLCYMGDMIRAAGYKVAAGNWSVTTPYPMAAWDIISKCFSHIDYMVLHGYSKPNLTALPKELYPHELIIDYLSNRNLPIPKFVLGEFGVDHKLYGTEFGGWQRSMSEGQLVEQLIESNGRLEALEWLHCAFWFIVGAASEWVEYDILGRKQVMDVFSQSPRAHTGGPNSPLNSNKVSEPMNENKSRIWLPPELLQLFHDWRAAALANGDAPEPFTDEERDRFIAHAKAIGAWAYADPVEKPKPSGVKVAKPKRNIKSNVDKLLHQLSTLANCDPLYVQAVSDIESGGRALDEQGNPIKRFEPKQWVKKVGFGLAEQYFQGLRTWQGGDDRMAQDGEWITFHGDQVLETAAVALASSVTDRDLAYQCTSWGSYQLMGWHYERLGYTSAEDMAESFKNVKLQTVGFFQFVATGRNLLRALREKDSMAFALEYNGSGQQKRYAKLIDDRYKKLKG